MNRKLICLTMAALLLFALTLNACGKKAEPETTQPTTVPVATQPAEELNLTTWSLSASTWSSPNGATTSIWTGRARISSSVWRTRPWRPLPAPGRTATMWRTLT